MFVSQQVETLIANALIYIMLVVVVMILWNLFITPLEQPDFDDSWDLIDPHTQQVKTVSARALWVKILQNRMETGEPYLMFEDAVKMNYQSFKKKKDFKYIIVIFVQ